MTEFSSCRYTHFKGFHMTTTSKRPTVNDRQVGLLPAGCQLGGQGLTKGTLHVSKTRYYYASTLALYVIGLLLFIFFI